VPAPSDRLQPSQLAPLFVLIALLHAAAIATRFDLIRAMLPAVVHAAVLCAALPLLLPGPRHGLRELLDDRAGAAGVALDPAIEIDSYSQIKSLAQRGLGFGVLPRMAVEHERRARAFRLWRFDPQITRDVYLAYSTDRSLRNASRAVAGLAWDILRGLVREGAWAAELSPEARRAAPLSLL
jgi:DNA-binding transcriptional LysR family regulator